MAVRRRLRFELQPVASQLPVELVEHNARLHHTRLPFAVDRHRPIAVLRPVDDHGSVRALAAQTCSGATRQHRRTESRTRRRSASFRAGISRTVSPPDATASSWTSGPGSGLMTPTLSLSAWSRLDSGCVTGDPARRHGAERPSARPVAAGGPPSTRLAPARAGPPRPDPYGGHGHRRQDGGMFPPSCRDRLSRGQTGGIRPRQAPLSLPRSSMKCLKRRRSPLAR